MKRILTLLGGLIVLVAAIVLNRTSLIQPEAFEQARHWGSDAWRTKYHFSQGHL